MSTRAEITATRFTNEYHWGSFRGDPEKMMASYFDAFLYLANRGTRHLMFRVPGSRSTPSTPSSTATPTPRRSSRPTIT